MKGPYLLSILFTLLLVANGHAQTTQDSTIIETNKSRFANKELKGLVLDIDKQTALPYANIYVLHKSEGAISNENGYFSIDISDPDKTDTICFQYIGYKSKKVLIGQLDTSSVIYLKEEIYNLSETLIFGNPPDPVSIVKKVLKNKESNYQQTTCVRQTFIRERDIADFDSFSLNYKKSTIPELNREALQLFEEKIPKHTTSYTDFLGNIYITKNQEDSVKLKVDPIRTVSLKEKDIDELEQFDTIFENLFTTTEENEYWKFKSGIFSQKIDKTPENPEPVKDTLDENKRKLSYFGRGIESHLGYSLLDNKNQWEFLHETGRYTYSLTGGTSFNGEDVYIIDFKPEDNGLYVGRMYISVNTFALIRADYEYAPGKIGHDVHLLGIGYTETQFSGSIYFEKKGSNYILKYFSKKAGTKVSVNRNLEISKKRKRVLFDKELMDFDIEMDISVRSENSIEYYVLDDREISDSLYEDFKQQEYMDVIYVDQFDDKLWSGFSIIEPTRQMKEYKKQDVNFNE
ncbi:MAG: carboxypeptidase-like regulatory domain-containing protein [Bacteroidales bacterium]|nr:carboxypeptidase-like regulatory domain-containing protein [Bacteroidales bacterium]